MCQSETAEFCTVVPGTRSSSDGGEILSSTLLVYYPCCHLHEPLFVLHILVQVVSTESLSAEFQHVIDKDGFNKPMQVGQQIYKNDMLLLTLIFNQRLSVHIKSFKGVCLHYVYKESEHSEVRLEKQFSSEEWLGSLLSSHPRFKQQEMAGTFLQGWFGRDYSYNHSTLACYLVCSGFF